MKLHKGRIYIIDLPTYLPTYLLQDRILEIKDESVKEINELLE